MIASIKSFWESTKSFFKYSETIFIARLTALSGLVTAAVGAMDWSPLLSLHVDTGLSKAQVMFVGGITFLKGILDEVARRRNANL